jgi:hypothetical protein
MTDEEDEDRHYQGSCFQEVRNAIFANPYYSTWDALGQPSLPIFSVNLPQYLTGVLPLGYLLIIWCPL